LFIKQFFVGLGSFAPSGRAAQIQMYLHYHAA